LSFLTHGYKNKNFIPTCILSDQLDQVHGKIKKHNSGVGIGFNMDMRIIELLDDRGGIARVNKGIEFD
jgi:hypothetical protein